MITEPATSLAAPAAQLNSRLAVYFDGSCPMCTSEICYYQARRGADGIDWVDISALSPGSMVEADLSKSDAMARFHVRRPDGTLVSGAAAFALLWTALPAFRIVGQIASLPGIVHALELTYRAFLPIRPWLQRRMIARMRNPG
jgi:predicted DCC family thiol-disulfide oxidoreductase YuxK